MRELSTCINMYAECPLNPDAARSYAARVDRKSSHLVAVMNDGLRSQEVRWKCQFPPRNGANVTSYYQSYYQC